MGIGDWGLGIGDWGLGPIPNPQIPNPQSPIPNPQCIILYLLLINIFLNYNKILVTIKFNCYYLSKVWNNNKYLILYYILFDIN